MFKTIFLVRDGKLDSVMNAEWPEHVTNEAVGILADLRGKRNGTTLKEIVGDEVIELCEAFTALQLRARFNMLRGPYVLNSTKKPTDEELLAYANAQRKERNEPKAERDDLEQEVKDAETALAFAHLNDEGDAVGECQELVEEARAKLADWDSGYKDEMVEMERIADEVPDSETMVNKSYWVEYVEEMVKDIGDMPKKIPDYIVIDWDATAENVRADYAEIDFNGVTFYYRSN